MLMFEQTDPIRLYLDLLKKCLTDSLHIEENFDNKRRLYAQKSLRPKQMLLNVMIRTLESRRMQLFFVRNENISVESMKAKRAVGKDWPKRAETMIGLRRLENIQFCIESVLRDGIPGDCVETGVWRGGATIFMRGILRAYGVTDRRVWVADSFEGLPPPDSQKYSADAGDGHHQYEEMRIGIEQVKKNFEKYGLLDDQVQFLKGWFEDTLPTAPIDRIAVLRLDGDMYGSTMVAFESLYRKLSPGGFLIVDDFGLPACRKAVEDYRNKHSITEEIIPIDQSGVYWRKNRH